MKKIFLLIAIVGLALVTACGGKDGGSSAEDSLRADNKNLNEFLDIVATYMDSINGQESSLFIGKDGQPLSSKDQIRSNLQIFKYTVEQQRKRIEELEAQLANSNDEQSAKLRSIIANLRVQLEEKDAYIAELEAELDDKDFSIAQLTQEVTTLNNNVSHLNTRVRSLNQDVSSLNSTVEQQNEQIEARDQQIAQQQQQVEQLTTAYYRFGTKDELMACGILSGGKLAKKKFDASNVNNANFHETNTSAAQSFTIPGKKPEIMTQHPAGSYTLSGNTLTITNPAKFWSVSHYLVVKHK